jgi:hypothetical protein
MPTTATPSVNRLASDATLPCLTGCAIGEVRGLGRAVVQAEHH